MVEESVEARKWIEKAESDLNAAQVNFDNRLYDIAAFLCHQSVEKALKALSLKLFNKFDKVHDLVALGRGVGLPDEFLEYCKKMTGAYFYARYPDMPEAKNLKKRCKLFIAWSGEVLEWIKKQL